MSDIKTKFHGHGDDAVTIERTQDVQSILESNVEAAKHQQDNKAFGRRVASIPNIVIEQWIKEGVNLFDMQKDPDVRKEVLKRLNSPEWRYLRTHNSRL